MLLQRSKPQNFIDEYLIMGSSNDNANRVQSYADMKAQISDRAISEYTISKYPPDIAKLHNEGYIYIHDRSNGIVPYCHGGDLYTLLSEGLWTTHVVSNPPKHLSSALGQIANYFGSMQQEWAGAQAFGDFNTLLAPLLAKDHLTDSQLLQLVQEFEYDTNYPFRGGLETPFTNIMFNSVTPEHLADKMVVTPGMHDSVYGDYYDESMRILKAFNTIYGQGDASGSPFTFPIPTINLVPGMDWNDPVWDEVFTTVAKYGTYYFMNYLGTGYKPGSKKAMCCRFNIDLDAIADAGGRWANEGSTGSVGVVAINMAKIGYKCRDSNHILETLEYLADKVKESLLLKTAWCQNMIDSGYLPMSKRYRVDFSRFFRTVGMLGFDEMFMNLNGGHIWDSDNMKLAKEIMEFTRDWTRKTQQETGMLWNWEQVPGESAASSLALIDRKMHPGIYTLGTPSSPYYSTLLTPPSIEMPINKRIGIEQEILPLYSGGTAHRIFMGESIPSALGAKKLVNRIATFSRIPYFDLAATFTICPSDGYISGIHRSCPKCGAHTKIYNRITGYYRDINSANSGKKQEFLDRKYISI